MTFYESLSLILEFAVLVVLLAEYFYGRPDIMLKNEAKRRHKARIKYQFESLTQGEGK